MSESRGWAQAGQGSRRASLGPAAARVAQPQAVPRGTPCRRLHDLLLHFARSPQPGAHLVVFFYLAECPNSM